MSAINIRNLFNLHGRKIIAVVLLVSFSLSAQAQIKGTFNFLEFEKKPYYFGITLGINSSNYKITHAKDFILNDSINIAESIRGPGFNLGIVTNLKLGQYFDLRALPTLSFIERRLNYTLTEQRGDFVRKVESVHVEFPFHVRYKSAPYKDLRVFVVGGIKYSFDVASESRTRQALANELVKVSPSDFQVEYGVGIQYFFPYFIFSPEFKVSQGISNILLNNDVLVYSNALERILSRTFTISFHFEG